MKKLLLTWMLSISLAASANYSEAVKALGRQDYPNALQMFMKLSENGNAQATTALGLMYLQGLGVSKDGKKALDFYKLAADQGSTKAQAILATVYSEGLLGVSVDATRAKVYAQQAAANNNPEELFTLYQVISKHEIGTLNLDGSVNREKYMALAKRDVLNRKSDVEAYNSLSLAAEAGYLHAMTVTALLLTESVGLQNHSQALQQIELIQAIQKMGGGQLPPENAKLLSTISQQLTYLKGLGSTYATPKAFKDAQLIVSGSVLNAAGKLDDKKCDLRVTQVRVSQPFQDAFFLPVTAKLLKDTILIKGSWQEEWKFDACGTTVIAPISFTSDGLNGLFISSAGAPVKQQ